MTVGSSDTSRWLQPYEHDADSIQNDLAMGTRESLEFTEAEHEFVQVDADIPPDPAEVIPVDQDVSHTLVPEIAVCTSSELLRQLDRFS